jgi:hypothetical protein
MGSSPDVDRSVHRTLRWTGFAVAPLAGAFTVLAVEGGDVSGPWWLIVTLLAVVSTSLMAIGLYLVVDAATTADMEAAHGTYAADAIDTLDTAGRIHGTPTIDLS